MELFDENTFLNLLLQDCFSVHLAILGIGFSVFTLLYSFIYSKSNELEIYSNALKKKNEPLYGQRFERCRIFIKRLSMINSKCIKVIIISSILCFFSWISSRFFCSNAPKIIFLSIISIFSVLEFIIVGRLIYNILKQYKNDVDI